MNIYSILQKNRIELDLQQYFHFSILDKLGETVVEVNSKSLQQILKISPGLYHLEINNDKGTVQQKIII